MGDGGSLAGNESATVLSILRSRRRGWGFNRMLCRSFVSISSNDESIMAHPSVQALALTPILRAFQDFLGLPLERGLGGSFDVAVIIPG